MSAITDSIFNLKTLKEINLYRNEFLPEERLKIRKTIVENIPDVKVSMEKWKI